MFNVHHSGADLLGQLKGLDISSLEPLQRALLVTNGTLTEILEAVFLQRLGVVKVVQQVISPTSSHEDLEWKDDEVAVDRRVLLRGELLSEERKRCHAPTKAAMKLL